MWLLKALNFLIKSIGAVVLTAVVFVVIGVFIYPSIDFSFLGNNVKIEKYNSELNINIPTNAEFIESYSFTVLNGGSAYVVYKMNDTENKDFIDAGFTTTVDENRVYDLLYQVHTRENISCEYMLEKDKEYLFLKASNKECICFFIYDDETDYLFVLKEY